MVTILPKEEGYGAGELFGSGLASGYMNRADQNAIQNALGRLPQNASARDILNAVTGTNTYSNEAKQQALKNYLGVAEFEELQRKTREQEVAKRQELDIEAEKNRLKALEPKKKTDAEEKKEEKLVAAEGALKTIEDMRAIRSKGNLGIVSPYTKFISPETAKDFGQYEQLGKSLIQMSTNIPIRNRQEFEVLAHGLYDPSITDAQAEGILSALESIIKRGIAFNEVSGEPEKNQRPPLSSFQGK